MTTKLLSIDTNAKTVKGQKQGYLTGILYLSPADLSGTNLCSMAKLAGCIEGCLNSAGRGAFNNVQSARLRKTQWFLNDQQSFMLQLAKDIGTLIRKANKLGMIPVVRLNGTSDIRWENIRFEYTFAGDKVRATTIFQLFPEIQFYDYTKIPNRKDIPRNYDLTFSYSGRLQFNIHNLKALAYGMRIAVVFNSKSMPGRFLDRPVINGDDSDLRFKDPKKSIIGLYAKGRAKKDQSGFVVKFPIFSFKLED
jgi:hypothetical protein